EVALVFVPGALMRDLNARFRGIARTTDVLSFGEAIPAGVKGTAAVPVVERRRRQNGGRFDLGEVVISPDQAAKQARRRRRALVDEIAFPAAHGMLHPPGFEAATPASYPEMLGSGHEAARQSSVK